MVEGWITLRNDGRQVTHHASAALASLGCPVRTHLLHAYGSNAPQQRTFFISPTGEASWLPIKKGHTTVMRHVLALWKAGNLQDIDPLHPFLDAMRALENLRLIREAARGRIGSLCLALEPGAPRTRLMVGSEIPSLTQAARAIVHEDCRVAALCSLGVPLQSIQRDRFIVGMGVHLARSQELRVPDHEPIFPIDPVQILQAYNAGTLRDTHPFVIGLRACHAYQVQCRHLNAEHGNLLVRRKPRVGEHNPRRAFLNLNATGEVFDRVEQFIETGI